MATSNGNGNGAPKRKKNSYPEREKALLRRARVAAEEELLSARPVKKRKKELVPRNRKKLCKGKNLRGDPCRSAPLRKGTELDGGIASGEYCIFHDANLPESVWRRFQQKGSTALSEGRRPRPFEVAARAFELAPRYLLQPYLDVLGLDIDDQTGEIFETVEGGAKLHGFSRDGRVRRSNYDDLEAKIRAVEKLGDRFYGKARQAVDLAGGTGAAQVVVIPMTVQRGLTVAQVLLESGAINTADDTILGTAVEVENEDDDDDE